MAELQVFSTPEEEFLHWHQVVDSGLRTTLEAAWKAGKALEEIKASRDHGTFGTWLEEQGVASRTARRYMELARAFPSNRPPMADMSGGIVDTLRMLKAPVARSEKQAEESDRQKPLSRYEKTLVDNDHLKKEADELRRKNADLQHEDEVKAQVIEAQETEIRIAGGKPQVRQEVVGAKEEARILKRKLKESEAVIAELRKECSGLRRRLKKLRTA